MDNKYSIVSLNVRGLRSNRKFTIFNWLKEKKFDFCLLQETFCTKSFEKSFKRGWNGDIYHSYSDSVHCKGVCILIRKNINCKVISSFTDSEGRFLLINVNINDLVYTICNVYCPTSVQDRITFLLEIESYIKVHAIAHKNLIIAGDVNCVDNALDRVSGILDKSTPVFKNMKHVLDIVDIWRIRNDSKIEYTYIDPSIRGRNSRIDVVLLSKTLLSCAESCSILQAPAPDHKAVNLHINTNVKSRGKGFWKLNNTVLQHKEYVTGITELCTSIIQEYENDVSPSLLWEYMKSKIKSFSISYCINNAKSKQSKLAELERKINDLDHLLTQKNDIETAQERKELKKAIDDIYSAKAQGHQVRARAKWIADGEKSSSYFLNLEKIRQTESCINELKDTNGNIQASDVEILKIAHTFYSNLYSTTNHSNHDITMYLAGINQGEHTVLSDDEKETCEGEISLAECTQAMRHIKKNKSPGLDGLTIEFYEKFWSLLGPIIVNVYNNSYDNEILPKSLRTSVMNLIFKKGSRDNIANYRPISITNIDYKILAFALSFRLQNVITSLVDTDQSAYIKGRYMGNNIRLVSDVIELFSKQNRSGLVLTIDFEKAFDSLNWDFLIEVLKYYNFGSSFIKWVQLMYTLPTAHIKNNGYISQSVDISRGIRQGCPASAILFILCVEILGSKIRSDQILKGFNFDDENKAIKISQYADDTMLFLNNHSETAHAFDVIENFGKVSGLILNKEKCEGLYLGKNENELLELKRFNIKWPVQLKYLGIFLGHNKMENDRMNWDTKLTNIQNILKTWSNRELSMIGRVQVIKALAISQLTLQASLLPIPRNIIVKVNKILYTFLWKSNEKVKRDKMIQNMENGGLKMIDIESYFESLKAEWVNRIYNSNPLKDAWVQIPTYIFNINGFSAENLKFNFDSTVHFKELRSLPPFYQEILMYYNKPQSTDIDSFKQNISSQPLWGNKHINRTQRGKTNVLFFRNWIRSGINDISHLQFLNGVLDETFVYRTVRNKQNIYAETLTVKHALLPYRNSIINILEDNDISTDTESYTKTKHFYNKLTEIKSININPLSIYLTTQLNQCIEKDIFKVKVKEEKENKLREFNFKLLHGILPCNKNLMKWKKRDNDQCDVCQHTQSIEHLLFNCTYVKPIWNKVNEIFDINVSFDLILGIEKTSPYNRVLTLVAFLIYKEWLVLSFEYKARTNPLIFAYFKSEIKLRIDIYKQCNLYDDLDLQLFESLYNML